ncbi:MAG TPA: PIN domain-containing protein [Planctomycetota bacterium]|nr:PIN domain-containing protein [Planctomycetota bacterium]
MHARRQRVASSRAQEPGYVASRRLLDEERSRGVTFFCPVLVLPESAAAIARATDDVAKAARMIGDIRSLPRLQLVTIDDSLATRAAEIAMTYRLKGADSVYVAVAEASAATLITWDGEMLERAPAVVPKMSPADWLARQPATP